MYICMCIVYSFRSIYICIWVCLLVLVVLLGHLSAAEPRPQPSVVAGPAEDPGQSGPRPARVCARGLCPAISHGLSFVFGLSVVKLELQTEPLQLVLVMSGLLSIVRTPIP